MPRTLARCLLTVALILTVVASAARADAAPAKVGDATARELAAQSREPVTTAPPPRPRARATAAPHRKAAPSARPHANAKGKPHANAKPKHDRKIKASAAKAKPRARHAPVRPSVAPAKRVPSTHAKRA